MDGELPDGWTYRRIDEIASVVGGTTPSRKHPDYFVGRLPWVTPTDVTRLSGRYLDGSAECISNEAVTAAGLQVLPAGTVLLTSRATIGATAIATQPVTTNQGFQNLVPCGSTDTLWLYYAIKQRKPELDSLGSGSTFREFSRQSLRSLRLPVPPQEEQIAIARVLDAIDEAIEKTEAVIAATEDLRKALLQELLTRGVPGWHTEWKTVPGIGTIPACWDVVRLGEVARIRNGTTPSKARPDFWSTEGFPFIRTGQVNDRVIAHGEQFLTEAGVRNGAVVVPKDSVLIAMIGQGKTRGMAAKLETTAAINQNFAAVTTLGRLDSNYFYTWAGHNYEGVRGLGQGSNQGALNCGLIASMLVPLPSLPEQQHIAEFVAVIDRHAAAEQNHLNQLKHVKDLCADVLLTGRVRVPLVEVQVE